MAEYRRIVSYLYKYTNGQKGENVGFVRVETRSDGLRLFFHVKDLRMMDERKIKAYFYFHEGEQKKAIFVDEFLCSRGNCEYKEIKNEREILGERELLELDGMVFYDQKGLLYGTCWDEREIVEGNIMLPGIEMPEEISAAPNVTVEVPDMVEEQPEKIESEPLVPKEETGPVMVEIETEVEELEEEKVPKTGAELEPEVESEPEVEAPNLRMEEVEKLSNMEKMLSEYLPVSIKWDSNLVEAVKMKPEDISRFPIKDWRLAENAFLLQGYEIHKYLILGRIQMRPERHLWVLGVPGIYNNREKYLAGIFGFHDYIPMEQGRLKTGGKGFWITPLSVGNSRN